MRDNPDIFICSWRLYNVHTRVEKREMESEENLHRTKGHKPPEDGQIVPECTHKTCGKTTPGPPFVSHWNIQSRRLWRQLCNIMHCKRKNRERSSVVSLSPWFYRWEYRDKVVVEIEGWIVEMGGIRRYRYRNTSLYLKEKLERFANRHEINLYH